MGYYAWDSKAEIETLVGKTFTTVTTEDPRKEEHLLLLENDNEAYAFVHFQDCCEHVYFESCDNDLQLLVGQEILEISERTEEGHDTEWGDSYTWTFYHIRTARDTFVIRFNGESNGYYSESVDLIDLNYDGD